MAEAISGSLNLVESAVALARLHASLGEVDPTLAWVERAQDLLKADGSHFKADDFDLVRDHPRFKKVVPYKRRR
jgi:hypothetical protein